MSPSPMHDGMLKDPALPASIEGFPQLLYIHDCNGHANIQNIVFHGIIPYPSALTFILSTLLQFSTHIGVGDIDVFFYDELSQSLILLL